MEYCVSRTILSRILYVGEVGENIKFNPLWFIRGDCSSSCRNRTYNMALEEPCYVHLTKEPNHLHIYYTRKIRYRNTFFEFYFLSNIKNPACTSAWQLRHNNTH